jgi:SAM-dependent methyltransferase
MTGSSYIIEGGEAGRARLSVLSQAMAEATGALLDRVNVPRGAMVLDAGCGGGDVTRQLKDRAGPGAEVIGIDLDEAKLAAARALSPDIRFERRRLDAPGALDDLGPFDLIYARFLLSHLTDPAAMLAAFRERIKPGGRLVVEDVEFAAHLCWPPRASFDRYVVWYRKAARKRGADADIGPKLTGLLRAAGFQNLEARVVQPGGLTGAAKQMAPLTLDAISESLIASGIAGEAEIARDVADLQAAAADPTIFMTLPRVMQVWGARSSAARPGC